MTRRPLARLGAAAILAIQLLLIVRAYSAPIDTFGFQMFPESSQWEADIVRVLRDGSRIDIAEPWPGGYRWDMLVDARGLGSPRGLHHADAGLDATLHLLQASLDWVAGHTPADTETVRLEATVTVVHNGRSPTTRLLVSETRG